MKILILIPVYKRPEVLSLCLKSLKWFISKVSWQIRVVCILSPEDKFLKDNEKHIKKHGFKAVYFKNLPVSDKINAGIEYISRHYDFDYLMNFGSDDLIHPQIEQLYEPFFKKNCPFFGINTLYFIDLNSRKTIFFDIYAINGATGAGRMISKSIVQHFSSDIYPIYEPGLDCGLDTNSSMTIKRNLIIPEVIVESGTFPYIVDLKTYTNINQFIEIESRKENIKPSTYNHLKSYFPVL